MSGRDVIGIAKTGSGKTLAYLLPMLRRILYRSISFCISFTLPSPTHKDILDQPPLEIGDGMIGLIMVPTRELAMQIHAECKVSFLAITLFLNTKLTIAHKFTKSLGLHSVCVYGGSGVADQIADLKRGAEIVVCTPGRISSKHKTTQYKQLFFHKYKRND